MSFAMIDPSSGHLTSVIDRAIDQLFCAGASDITIQSDDYVWAYINRLHVRVSTRRLDDGEVATLIRHLYKTEGVFGHLGSGQSADLDTDIRPRLMEDQADFDPDYSVRCRVNITACRVGTVANGYSVTLRTIPGVPPSFKSLNLPGVIADCFFPSQGLVLVVGITGSGKSTLLSSAMRELLENPQRPVKIGTYEEPIEFVFPRVPVIGGEQGSTSVTMPEVSQVQIGHHLKEFHLAAPNALRRKFDVLVMGEMRDKGSVDTGLLLASTGHATYATLHCETPAEAIGRILSEFPYDAQPSVANKLLSNLRVIVAQKIERNMAGKGVAFRSWCIFDQAFKADLYEMPHQQWGRKIEKRMQANGSTFAQQAYGPLMRGEISESAFANIAGFNPVEAREYLANCRTQEALDREGVEHEG
jgi:defect-in-organelle-trafficking protein DotB